MRVKQAGIKGWLNKDMINIWQYPKQIRWSTMIYNIKLIRSNHA